MAVRGRRSWSPGPRTAGRCPGSAQAEQVAAVSSHLHQHTAPQPCCLPFPPSMSPHPNASSTAQAVEINKGKMTTKAVIVTLAGIGGGWAQDGSVGDGDTVVTSALSRGWLCPGPTPLTPQLLAQRLSSPARRPGRKGTSWARSPPSVQRGVLSPRCRWPPKRWCVTLVSGSSRA